MNFTPSFSPILYFIPLFWNAQYTANYFLLDQSHEMHSTRREWSVNQKFQRRASLQQRPHCLQRKHIYHSCHLCCLIQIEEINSALERARTFTPFSTWINAKSNSHQITSDFDGGWSRQTRMNEWKIRWPKKEVCSGLTSIHFNWTDNFGSIDYD